MLARVTTFEGGTADGIRSAMEALNAQIPAGPPPGVNAKGLTVLADAEAGRVLWIGLFENEEALRSSEAALSQVTLPPAMGAPTSLNVFEVAAEARV
jgi:hypothetical protein